MIAFNENKNFTATYFYRRIAKKGSYYGVGSLSMNPSSSRTAQPNRKNDLNRPLPPLPLAPILALCKRSHISDSLQSTHTHTQRERERERERAREGEKKEMAR